MTHKVLLSILFTAALFYLADYTVFQWQLKYNRSNEQNISLCRKCGHMEISWNVYKCPTCGAKHLQRGIMLTNSAHTILNGPVTSINYIMISSKPKPLAIINE